MVVVGSDKLVRKTDLSVADSKETKGVLDLQYIVHPVDRKPKRKEVKKSLLGRFYLGKNKRRLAY